MLWRLQGNSMGVAGMTLMTENLATFKPGEMCRRFGHLLNGTQKSDVTSATDVHFWTALNNCLRNCNNEYQTIYLMLNWTRWHQITLPQRILNTKNERIPANIRIKVFFRVFQHFKFFSDLASFWIQYERISEEYPIIQQLSAKVTRGIANNTLHDDWRTQ